MATYCISDIHGYYEEFMALLEKIKFNHKQDTLYILGDAIDRGKRPMDCLLYIMKAYGIRYIRGNHDQMMLDYYMGKLSERALDDWDYNGGKSTMAQIANISADALSSLLHWLNECPVYETISINGRNYFLSHAGLNVSKPFQNQTIAALTWSREEFYKRPALLDYTVIFGHTPVFYINKTISNCSIWIDDRYSDKICIDCGCVYGGALAALRLDDGKVFYEPWKTASEWTEILEKKRKQKGKELSYDVNMVPEDFYNMDKRRKLRRID